MADGTLKVGTITTSSGSGTITLGQSGETIAIPSGVTLTNSGTATGFGKVLQVVSTAFTSTNTSTTSTSDVAISGFSASITPSSASNKVLILVNANGLSSTATYGLLKVYKNGSQLIQIAGQFSYDGNVSEEDNSSASVSYLDSPSTTSSTTYAIYWRSGNGSGVFINANASTSTITLMEIAV